MATIHMLGPGDAGAACGAELRNASMDSAFWDWTEDEREVECEDCLALYVDTL